MGAGYPPREEPISMTPSAVQQPCLSSAHFSFARGYHRGTSLNVCIISGSHGMGTLQSDASDGPLNHRGLAELLQKDSRPDSFYSQSRALRGLLQ